MGDKARGGTALIAPQPPLRAAACGRGAPSTCAGRCPGARPDAAQQDGSVRAPAPRLFQSVSFSSWPCLGEHSSGYGFVRGRAAAAQAAEQMLEQDRGVLIDRHGADPGAAATATAPRRGRREERAHVLLPGEN